MADILGASNSPNHLLDKVHKNSASPAHTTHSSSSGGAAGLNPRSCVTCRKRKVRCDKRNPCSNCQKAHIDCIFPAPGRAPRKPRKPPDGELLARLRKLEGVVSSLGASVDEDGSLEANIPHNRSASFDQRFTSPNGTPTDSVGDQHNNSLDNGFGRLVINEGKSRYVNNSFWANLNNEVEDLKGILHESSEDDDELPSPETGVGSTSSHESFIFGYSSLHQDLSSFHPSKELIAQYWTLYVDHCDPLIKMFHLPTLKELVDNARQDTSKCTKHTEALLFSIYFAVITSLSDEECLAVAGEDRSVLVQRYRFAFEQSLARANFLVSDEIILVQALSLFLMCLRRHEDARVIWSLSGLVVRMAITMGLHRDGSNFGLSPYETEIRRRTWWQVCVLDIRTAEDHGCDPTIVEHTFDTQFPLNVNDEDFDQHTKEPPKEREGVCEMTFCLIRFEVCNTFRRLSYHPTSHAPCYNKWKEITLRDKENWIEECHAHLEEKYLRHCDMNIPMQWVICTVARLVMAKMWLVIYHPFQRLDGGQSLAPSIRDRLFITSVESIEYSLLLETEVRTVKWGWLFKTYCQWHAFAFLLTELCTRTKGPIVGRAWRAVDATLTSMSEKYSDKKKSHLWRPLHKLLSKARAAREKEIQAENPGVAQGMVSYGSEIPPSQRQADFHGLDTSSDWGMSDHSGDTPALATALAMTPDSTSESLMTKPGPTTTAPYLGRVEDREMGTTMSLSGDEGGTIPAKSPFFANQPQVDLSQWPASTPGAASNADFLNYWFQDQNEDVLSNETAINANGAAAQPVTGFGQAPGYVMGNAPSMEDQNMGMTNVAPFAADTLMAGEGVQWDEWEDMMRGFEMEGGAGSAQWHKRGPVMSESWL